MLLRLVCIVAVSALAAPAFAQLTPITEVCYEADQLPQHASPSWSFHDRGRVAAAIDPPGVLHVTLTADPDPPFGDAWVLPDPLSQSTGRFFIETRARMISGCCHRLDGRIDWVWATITLDQTSVAFGGADPYYVHGMNTTDGFHVYRVEVDVLSNYLYGFVDGTLVFNGTQLAGRIVGSDNLFLGSYNHLLDGEFLVDYVKMGYLEGPVATRESTWGRIKARYD